MSESMHTAFVTAYADMSNPKKNAANPAFRSKYANLEELLNVTRPLLAANGFAIVQEPVSDGDRIGVATKLMHGTGEFLDFGSYTVPLTKHDAQGAGSAITYCRRYALASIFGLAQEDDDGNAASKSDTPKAPANVASEKQIKYIRALAKKAGITDSQLHAGVKRDFGVDHLALVTSAQAKQLIDRLKPLSEAEEDVQNSPAIGDEEIQF